MKNYNVATRRYNLRRGKENGMLLQDTLKYYRNSGKMLKFGKTLINYYMGNTY